MNAAPVDKRLVTLFGAMGLALFFCCFQPTNVVSAEVPENASPTAFVGQYMAALMAGDTDMVLNLLGPDLAARYRRALSGPYYADHLRSVYQGAEVLDISHSRDSAGLEIVAVVRFDDGETRRIAFELQRRTDRTSAGFQVLAEREMP